MTKGATDIELYICHEYFKSRTVNDNCDCEVKELIPEFLVIVASTGKITQPEAKPRAVLIFPGLYYTSKAVAAATMITVVVSITYSYFVEDSILWYKWKWLSRPGISIFFLPLF